MSSGSVERTGRMPNGGAGGEGLPYRHLSRLQSAYHLDLFAILKHAGLSNFTHCVLVQSVARACVADWTEGGGVDPPSNARCSTTILATARSLHRPFETVRRQVGELLRMCYLEREGNALRLAVSGPRLQVLADCLERIHDRFLQLVEAARTSGVALPERRASLDRPTAAVLGGALDLSLEPLDSFRSAGWDWRTMLVWTAISAFEVRHVTSDPALSRLYAVDYTPDHLRRGVSLHSVARFLAMPYATAWRRAETLRSAGLMDRRSDGWVIAGTHLRDERVRQGLVALSNRLVQRLRSAVLLGADADAFLRPSNATTIETDSFSNVLLREGTGSPLLRAGWDMGFGMREDRGMPEFSTPTNS